MIRNAKLCSRYMNERIVYLSSLFIFLSSDLPTWNFIIFCCVCYNLNLHWTKTIVLRPFTYRECLIRFVYFRLILFVKLFWFILLKNEQVQQVILHVLFYITCIRISSEALLLFLQEKIYASNKYMKIPFSLNLFDQILKAYNLIVVFFTILMC